MTFRLKVLNFLLRNVERRALLATAEPSQIRRRVRLQTRLFFHPPFGTEISSEALSFSGQSVKCLKVGDGVGGVMLYLHGGAYIFGSAQTHRRFVAKLAADNHLTAYSINYRLAPEQPFPAAIDDAFTAYNALLARGIAAGSITIAGDSAGGGLALALLHRLLAEGLPRPRNLLAFSPQTDLTLSNQSLVENAKSEVMLPVERMAEVRDMVVKGSVKDPLASPLFGAFNNAPPVFISVGTTEILRDDGLKMVTKLRASGVSVTVDIGENLPHVWPFFHGMLPEADATLKRVQAFLSHPSP